jgi:hypothetical protein
MVFSTGITEAIYSLNDLSDRFNLRQANSDRFLKFPCVTLRSGTAVILGFAFHSQKCVNTFVNWYYAPFCAILVTIQTMHDVHKCL